MTNETKEVLNYLHYMKCKYVNDDDVSRNIEQIESLLMKALESERKNET